MASIPPVVRHMILCDEVVTGPDRPSYVSVIGLVHALHSPSDPPFPAVHPQLSVLLMLTECHGPGTGRIEIREADTDAVIFRGRTRYLPLPADPLELKAIVFRIRGCLFPTPGLYAVEFWYDGGVIAEQPLLLR